MIEGRRWRLAATRKALARGQLAFGLASLALISVALGIGLLIFGMAFGWFFLGLLLWPLTVYCWYQLYLRELPARGEALAEIIEPDLLAEIRDGFSPQQLAAAAMKVKGGHFFAIRLGIAPDFIRLGASSLPADSELVWEAAQKIAAQYRIPLDGGVLVAALILTQAPLRGMLPQLQLNETDVVTGARWYARLVELAHEKTKRDNGGIARDWAFGFTPLLERFAINITAQVMGGTLRHETASHLAALETMMTIFRGSGRQNVALVGRLGVGKTTLLYALAEKLMYDNDHVPAALRYQQVVALDASALVSATRSRGELEDLLQRLFIEAYHAKNIVLCLDDAHLFFEEAPGSIDLSNALMPVLESGALRIVLALDEQRWQRIAERRPDITAVLQRVNVAPSSEPETMAVLQDQLVGLEFQRKVTAMYQALREAIRLSARYMHDMAMPGAAVKLIEAAAVHASNGLLTQASVQQAIEEIVGTKVSTPMASEEERTTLLNLEARLHERMIGQSAAVSAVANALRRARAGVRNEKRPVGTFLFLGPTGVGKTELARSLAAVYFGGEDHMIRVDMNEYVTEQDVRRLIAPASQDEHGLVARISRQPFSVVLFDEIEKAHPTVLSSLLQVLDEGVLRDESNREIYFRDTIIIATSNAGAERIRELITQGHDVEQSEQIILEELISERAFTPEFLNRFDDTIVFAPLSRDDLLKVAQLIIQSINKTLEPQKIAIAVEPDALMELVRRGYDPRLGARPIRRVIQKHVESIIARRMLEGTLSSGGELTITLQDLTI